MAWWGAKMIPQRHLYSSCHSAGLILKMERKEDHRASPHESNPRTGWPAHCSCPCSRPETDPVHLHHTDLGTQGPPAPPEKLSAEHWEKLKQELILPLLGKQFPWVTGEGFLLWAYSPNILVPFLGGEGAGKTSEAWPESEVSGTWPTGSWREGI